MTYSDETTRTQAGHALKAMAADQRVRDAFLDGRLLADLFKTAADRYIVAADRHELGERLALLEAKGYHTGVEQVGEEARTADEVKEVVAEYHRLIEQFAEKPPRYPVQLGFDLSNVGSLVSQQEAKDNTGQLLEAAAELDMPIVLSMERSGWVDGILEVFQDLAGRYDNVGLTVQAHLHRTEDDLADIIAAGRKVRLVKGVYHETEDVALPRGPKLQDRYVALLQRLLDADVPVAVGTHDADLLERLRSEGMLTAVTEVEMLHGVQGHVLKSLREQGIQCRIATVYGHNWWLHFLHRLSEHPPNVITALADLSDPSRIEFGSQY
ncbi:proline dehydrogenase family protein [Haloglycomyces albus]|uniref:proline dehydrogenase family protein n=1 Tax=Haloglycomyces albus TaxID=526067 RepID=UPI00046CFCA5|nr:proline dehydrogenase family protein [Haloglycomyces albus]